jgi:hypothetical protein
MSRFLPHIGQARLHHGIFLVIPQIGSPGLGGAANQSPRLAFAELQYYKGSKVIGGHLPHVRIWAR